MKDPAVLRSLGNVYLLESRSFVRYLVEAASPLVRDEWDRKAQDFVKTWYEVALVNSKKLEPLFEKEEATPPIGSWPLEFTQYHYLDYYYLLRPLRMRMETILQKIEQEIPNLSGWPEAEAAARAVVSIETPYLARAEELEASRPQEPGPAGPRRRVSANWW